MTEYVVWLQDLGKGDVERVGGKNASLGEMISKLSSAGVRVPGGFATSADAYREFLSGGELQARIDKALSSLDVEDVSALARTGESIREWIAQAPLQLALETEIREAYRVLGEGSGAELSVAVRSSATAEDLPDASFAGQQETYLNVQGIEAVLQKVKLVFASLYNNRAIAYRAHHGYQDHGVALSVGVQKMIRSDLAASGVLFTMDTESGFRDAVLITSSYGLGETIVQGAVNPDEFYVHKPTLEAGRPAILRRERGSKAIKMIYTDDPGHGTSVQTVEVAATERRAFSLTDDEIEALARLALVIERHYGRPMDIEWGKDGPDGEICILQARPETVQTRTNQQILQRYRLRESSALIVTGRSIGQRIGSGLARRIDDVAEMNRVRDGDVLVTDMTDPDWEPIMKRASAIVTNRGGRTCHAAIIAREIGIPAVVGCGDATRRVEDGQPVTVSCSEGDVGKVYRGELEYEVDEVNLVSLPDLPFKIAMNVGDPDRAFGFAALPNAGVGLARIEFIINRTIGIHPRALLDFDDLAPDTQQRISERIGGYGDPVDFYVEKLKEGVATIAAAFHPKPVIVRLSDFKSNEYANLVGGDLYEPHEDNPMIGYRGASRYVSEGFRPCFELECQALLRVRDEMGLTNVKIMVPFVRTLGEAKEVIGILAEQGLERGVNGLEIMMMCELPSNALLAEEFLEYFDGFSIGSNDLTQLTLGLDRDSELIAHLFDERDPAVKKLLHAAIHACRAQGKYVGICGQGPSDHPDLAKWLMEEGIDSVSLNPDTVVETWLYLAGRSVD